ncbi:MAG: hypothetical protein UU48_C0009G0020 [Candidatus Uhrbacteria bacterium GW2011_GWF2_41_16]|uniref:GmrSD restriction endonucleases N-terminal domain-containing protein n=2 Tax=Candidatus Uhriibacteriota TaxID=1752732 RepID=A0A0G0V9P9_9BACT|nr:MAG: hypothetical protein UU35_C0011G0018 [Candidatus Uhrbacteria bacterium GW2011_GWC2_41_11]KKR97748.1 MAG: hypothetical protein UU48_C0009G0020 [Candidatus Uhrbacteria bacterium GW2011_GWF2_41_16]HBO99757.1 hypothetical protein [Candidatus Uhrbacteria bacterium]
MQKYTVNQYFVSNILNWVQEKEIAIPEIQRPFVWNSTKVRDLMDSLYKGFPIGYIIAWKNPDVRLKDGSVSNGKKILIDGQQRITALRAGVLGQNIINIDYKEERVFIAFHPLTEEFATLTPAIAKDKAWIQDISKLMTKDGGLFEDVTNYCEKNPEADRRLIEKNIEKLLQIKSKQIGFIELDSALDIETVTEIFIRINSKGVVLSQADFAMSKIASYDKEDHFGVNLRKCIDYFCHLSREPQFYKHISENDIEFKKTIYLSKITWLKDEKDDLYDPDYSDVLRVSFTKQFERGKMADLVGLLSGRNFETRTFEQNIMDDSFQKLRDAVLEYVNETNFKRFVMIIKSCGFTSNDLINSQNALNFAYILFLKLREKHENPGLIEKYVQRWFVMSLLTGRYSGSPESQFDSDIKQVSKDGAEKILQSIEDGQLSEAYWNAQLIQELDKASINNPFLNLFFAAQIKAGDKGFLSTDITVGNMIDHRGDIHHLFPREYLKVNGFERGDYNQIANFVYAQSEINIKVGKSAPKDYMGEVREQTNGGKLTYGGITDEKALRENLKQNCIPHSFEEMDVSHYENFLKERRKLMAKKIKDYYFGL